MPMSSLETWPSFDPKVVIDPGAYRNIVHMLPKCCNLVRVVGEMLLNLDG